MFLIQCEVKLICNVLKTRQITNLHESLNTLIHTGIHLVDLPFPRLVNRQQNKYYSNTMCIYTIKLNDFKTAVWLQLVMLQILISVKLHFIPNLCNIMWYINNGFNNPLSVSWLLWMCYLIEPSKSGDLEVC